MTDTKYGLQGNLKAEAYSEDFAKRIGALTAAITDQAGARLPGARRHSNRQKTDREGVVVDEGLVFCIREIGE